MTKAQLDNFQKLLGTYQQASLITMSDKRTQYLIIYYYRNGKPFRLDYVIVIYENSVLHKYEVDGFLRSYVLKALEQALEK